MADNMRLVRQLESIINDLSGLMERIHAVRTEIAKDSNFHNNQTLVNKRGSNIANNMYSRMDSKVCAENILNNNSLEDLNSVVLNLRDKSLRSRPTPLDSSKELITKTGSDIHYQRNGGNGGKRKKIKDISLLEGIKIPSKVKMVFESWLDCGFGLPNPDTKHFQKTVKNVQQFLSGKIKLSIENHEFTIEDVQTVIRRFSIAAFDYDYEPKDMDYKNKLQKFNLSDFFWNPFAPKEKSLFARYWYDKPKLISDELKYERLGDLHPNSTNIMIEFYKNTVLGLPDANLSTITQNVFISASVKLAGFLSRNKSNPRFHIDDLPQLATYLCEALSQQVWDVRQLSPGRFISDFTFEHILPAYLVHVGIIEHPPLNSSLNSPSKKEFSIYG